MPLSFTRFTPSQFTATQFSTVADKVAFADALVNFLENGCSGQAFTEKLYSRLSRCFGFIARYNRISFYDHWFETAERRLAFIQRTLNYSCCGDPQWTFSDAEQAIQEKLLSTNILQRYRIAAERSTNKKELALPARLLLAKQHEAKTSTVPATEDTAAARRSIAQTRWVF